MPLASASALTASKQLSPREKMNLANVYSAPGISSGPLGLEIDPGKVKRPFVLSELFSLIWSTRTTALKAFLILRRVSTKLSNRCMIRNAFKAVVLVDHRSEEHTSELQSPCNLV